MENTNCQFCGHKNNFVKYVMANNVFLGNLKANFGILKYCHSCKKLHNSQQDFCNKCKHDKF